MKSTTKTTAKEEEKRRSPPCAILANLTKKEAPDFIANSAFFGDAVFRQNCFLQAFKVAVTDNKPYARVNTHYQQADRLAAHDRLRTHKLLRIMQQYRNGKPERFDVTKPRYSV